MSAAYLSLVHDCASITAQKRQIRLISVPDTPKITAKCVQRQELPVFSSVIFLKITHFKAKTNSSFLCTHLTAIFGVTLSKKRKISYTAEDRLRPFDAPTAASA